MDEFDYAGAGIANATGEFQVFQLDQRDPARATS
jgi:hypothetical protein